MDKKPKIIIIKKIKKGGGGHHGGSWKVAYADFVTAMMAFFLLMWLLSMVSPEKRAVMSLYFKQFSLFEHGGKSFMLEGGAKPVMKSGGQEYYETNDETSSGFTEKEQMKGLVQAAVDGAAGAMKGNVLVDTSDEGIRIQIVDRADNPIFAPGSPTLSEGAKRILKAVSVTMLKLPNEIVVEGHTDASHSRNEEISNWELSTLRACSARRELEANGIEPNRIARVTGFADKMPLITADPTDSRNRRVSLVFMFEKKKHKPRDPYDWVWKSPTGKDAKP